MKTFSSKWTFFHVFTLACSREKHIADFTFEDANEKVRMGKSILFILTKRELLKHD